MTPVQEAIVNAARAAGEDPAYALAVASRESDFDPSARASKTIAGLYQMRGDLRAKYGIGDSTDPTVQTQGWLRSMNDVRATMAKSLGRRPTNEEAYLGDYYGPTRAAQVLKMDPSTPTWAIFTPEEMKENPEFAQAGTIGKLNASVMGDIGKRMARFGGASTPPSAANRADLSAYGDAAPDQVAPSTPRAPEQLAAASPAAMPDLSSFGDAAPEQPTPAAPRQPATPVDLSMPTGIPRMPGGGQLPDLSGYGDAGVAA